MIDPDSLFDEALDYHQSGDLASARAAYTQLLSLEPDNSALLHILGIVCFQQNEMADAEKNIRAAIALRNDNPAYHKNLGNVLKAQGRSTEAVEAFQAAIRLQPDFHDALNDLGSAYFDMGRLREAEDIFRGLIEKSSNRAGVLHNLGVLLLRQGKIREAKQRLEDSLELDPENLDARISLGKLLLQCSEFDLAAEHLETVYRHRANDPRLLMLLAHARRESDPARALRLARAAIEIAPDDPACHVAHGSALQSLGRFDDAEAAYQAALAVDPNDADALNNLGTIFKERDDIKRAQRCFEKAIEQRETLADAHYNLGTVMQDLGHIDQAIGSFQRALSLRPERSPAYRCLADIYQATDRNERAVEVLERWLEDEPDNATAQHRLAAARQTGAPARASDDYVREEFDRFAHGFDKTLARLNYSAPEKIVECLRDNTPGRFSSVLDAGCGTGMAAALLKPFCASLFGVDLSPRMIERARMRVVYEDLTVGELVQYLNERPDYYDLVFSADTLVYFGDLRAFFAAANRSLISRSYLAFSIEHLEETLEGSYVLNSSGRYSHKESYVRSALIDAGFEVKDLRRVVLREELNRPVPGLVVLARLRHIDTSSAKRVKR